VVFGVESDGEGRCGKMELKSLDISYLLMMDGESGCDWLISDSIIN
jgi:hypothetical protein